MLTTDYDSLKRLKLSGETWETFILRLAQHYVETRDTPTKTEPIKTPPAPVKTAADKIREFNEKNKKTQPATTNPSEWPDFKPLTQVDTDLIQDTQYPGFTKLSELKEKTVIDHRPHTSTQEHTTTQHTPGPTTI